MRRAGPIPEAQEYQEDIDRLVGEPVPWLLAAWPWIAALLIAALVTVAAMTTIDVVVTASGRLTSDDPPVVLQPLASAVLRDLRVRPGDAVSEGQILAVLDSTFTEADRASLEAQRRALLARQSRLESELLGETGTAGVPVAAEDELQEQLRSERVAMLAARRASLTADLAALRSSLAAEEAAGGDLAEQLAVAVEVEDMRQHLATNGTGSRLALLEAKSARLGFEQEQRRHRARLDEFQQRLVAKRAELEAFERDWERQILEELAQLGPQLTAVQEQLQKAARLDALTLLKAPRDGIVLEVARRAPGSLMREGEALVTLVPSGAPLIAEIVLQSADIGRLAPGTPTVLKIDAFPWRRHGVLEGHLRSVSRESYAPDQGAVQSGGMHRGQVALDLDQEGLRADDIPLPGMTLTAELKVGDRRVLEFFLEPLLRGLQESLREP